MYTKRTKKNAEQASSQLRLLPRVDRLRLVSRLLVYGLLIGRLTIGLTLRGLLIGRLRIFLSRLLCWLLIRGLLAGLLRILRLSWGGLRRLAVHSIEITHD